MKSTVSLFTRYDKWKKIALFNLLVVGITGCLLRAKILFPLPWIDHKFLLHAHSHFALIGWLVQLLSVCSIEWLSAKTIVNHRMVHRLFVLNLVGSYGMLLTFPFIGYAGGSIFFSTISIIYNGGFAVVCLGWLKKCSVTNSVKTLFYIAFLSLLISGLGPLILPVWRSVPGAVNLEIPLVYWFLHFQYNGFFLFAVPALYLSTLTYSRKEAHFLNTGAVLMGLALVPDYFLSLQWLESGPAWLPEHS